MAGKSTKQGRGEGPVDNAQAAIEGAKKLKRWYGDGISTQVVIGNLTSLPLHLTADDHFSGRFDYDPPPVIPAGMFGCFLHVKRDSALCGSVACVEYALDGPFGTTKARFGWCTPYSGTNLLGVELLAFGETGIDRQQLGQSSKGESTVQRPDDVRNFQYTIHAKFGRNDSSTRIEYTLKEQARQMGGGGGGAEATQMMEEASADEATQMMEGWFFSIWGGIVGGAVPLVMLLEPTPTEDKMNHQIATGVVAMICALSGFAAPAAVESWPPASRFKRTFARFSLMWTGVLVAVGEMTGLEGKSVDHYVNVVSDHTWQVVPAALVLFTAAVASTMVFFCVVRPRPFRRRAEGPGEPLLF